MLLDVIFALIIISAALFLHELGHAVAGLSWNKKAETEIYMGSLSKEKKLKLRLGRLTCYLAIAFSGRCRVSNLQEIPPPSYKQKLIFGAGGPLASLLAFLLLFFVAPLIPGIPGLIINRVAVVSLFVFVFTAIPYRYPAFLRNLGGLQTDGLYIVNVIKEMKKLPKVI